MEEPLSRFFSRSALIVAISYAALVGLLLIGVSHMSDLEAASVASGVIGLPWILVMHLIPAFNWFSYFLTITLNVATVYFFVLCVVRIFRDDSNGQL